MKIKFDGATVFLITLVLAVATCGGGIIWRIVYVRNYKAQPEFIAKQQAEFDALVVGLAKVEVDDWMVVGQNGFQSAGLYRIVGKNRFGIQTVGPFDNSTWTYWGNTEFFRFPTEADGVSTNRLADVTFVYKGDPQWEVYWLQTRSEPKQETKPKP